MPISTPRDFNLNLSGTQLPAGQGPAVHGGWWLDALPHADLGGQRPNGLRETRTLGVCERLVLAFCGIAVATVSPTFSHNRARVAAYLQREAVLHPWCSHHVGIVRSFHDVQMQVDVLILKNSVYEKR
jgi:hypothetical protein